MAKIGTGAEVVPVTISHKRFICLLSCLRFDNNERQEERKKEDTFAAIRVVFEPSDFIGKIPIPLVERICEPILGTS